MTVTLKRFLYRFSEEDRAKITARTAELIERELKFRDPRGASKAYKSMRKSKRPKDFR